MALASSVTAGTSPRPWKWLIFGVAAHERPQPLGGVIHSQPGLRVAPGSLELEAVADDAGVQHQLLDPFVAHGRQFHRVEAVHHLAITLAFAQNGDPRKPRLEPFEQKHLEQQRRVTLWRSPFLVMVGLVQRIVGTPKAAWHKAPMSRGRGESGYTPALYIRIPRYR